MSHHIVTANRLRDGFAVWLGRNGNFVERLQDAAIFTDGEIAGSLAAGEAAVAARQVVGVYKVPVELRDGRPVVTSVRERIRAAGPSVRLDLGIQAMETTP